MEYQLFSAGANIPHPKKAHRGGEDAYLVSPPTHSTIAVADGVGSWDKKGVNPKHFAEQILSTTYEFIKSGEKDPKIALTKGFAQTVQIGSATVCLGILHPDGIFSVANIGDSGFLVIRNGKILLDSEEQQHEFNYPYQLGRDEHGQPHGTDLPEDAETYRLRLEVGDIIVMGSDGLLDNLWPKQIVEIVNANMDESASQLAHTLAAEASKEAEGTTNYVPFYHRAKQEGVHYSSYTGGKMDDITAIVAYVGEED